MAYCPDCGWDGYLEGVSKPCGGLGGGSEPEDDGDGIDEYLGPYDDDEDEGRTGAPPDGPFRP